MSARKAVQIAAAYGGRHESDLYALADDGSIWILGVERKDHDDGSYDMRAKWLPIVALPDAEASS